MSEFRLAQMKKAVREALPEGAGDFTVTFRPPDRRARDLDNLVASFKAGQDGIALALDVDDSGFNPSHEIGDPVKGGAVVVEFEAA